MRAYGSCARSCSGGRGARLHDGVDFNFPLDPLLEGSSQLLRQRLPGGTQEERQAASQRHHAHHQGDMRLACLYRLTRQPYVRTAFMLLCTRAALVRAECSLPWGARAMKGQDHSLPDP